MSNIVCDVSTHDTKYELCYSYLDNDLQKKKMNSLLIVHLKLR